METNRQEKSRFIFSGLPIGRMADGLRGYSVFLCGLSYLAMAFKGPVRLEGLVTVITVLTLLQCLPAISGITRFACAGLFGLGSILLFASGADVATWCSAVTQNGKILTLMMFVPMLSIPFTFPRYRRSLEHVLQGVVRSDGGLYLLTHLTSHLIGVIVNIACVSITYYILKTGIAGRNLDMLARATARGYTTTCFWSPNSGALGLVLGYWGGNLVDVIPVGLPLAAVALALGWVENRLWGMREEEHGKAVSPGNSGAAKHAGSPEVYRDFCWLVIAVILLLCLVVFLDWATPLGILTIVPLMSLIYPFIWAVLAGETRTQWIHFKNFLSGGLPRMSNEVVIFLGAGFFAVAAGKSGAVQYLTRVFSGVSDSPVLLTAVIILIVVGLSLVGFHPVLTTTSIVASFTPQSLGLPAALLSVVVVTGWGLAVTCSPFSACSLSLSNMTGNDPFTVGVRWQLRFTLLLFLVALVYFHFVLLAFF